MAIGADCFTNGGKHKKAPTFTSWFSGFYPGNFRVYSVSIRLMVDGEANYMQMNKSAEGNDYAAELVAGLKIASPCSMRFEDMKHTDETYKRFCGDCSKNVFDVASMSREQVAQLVEESWRTDGTMPCLRLYRRTDGTVITDDCPVGLRRVRNFYRRLKASAAAFAAFFLGGMPNLQARADEPLMGKPMAPGPRDTRPLMGAVCPPNWAQMASSRPEIKKIQDELAALEKKSDKGSAADRAKLARLQLSLARAANSANFGYYASQVLEQAAALARQNGDKALLSDILKEKLNTLDVLKVKDKSSVQAEIDALKKEGK